MLISKIVKIRWNAKNKRRFVDLGYKFTKMNDTFDVKVEDLSNGSSAKIKVQCDYCGEIYELQYDTWTHRSNKETDCCGNPNCTSLKAKNVLKEKYGTENIRKIKGVNEKIKQTNLQKYGCENPFGNKDIQNKIKETTIKKYGCVHNSQNKEISKRKSISCKNFYKKHPERIKIKDKSPNWIGDADYKRSKRATFEYNKWRSDVYKRDNYTCQFCGQKHIILHVHHIRHFADIVEEILSENQEYKLDNPDDVQKLYQIIVDDKRFLDEDNLITLCKECHLKVHGKNKTISSQASLNDEEGSTTISKESTLKRVEVGTL